MRDDLRSEPLVPQYLIGANEVPANRRVDLDSTVTAIAGVRYTPASSAL